MDLEEDDDLPKLSGKKLSRKKSMIEEPEEIENL